MSGQLGNSGNGPKYGADEIKAARRKAEQLGLKPSSGIHAIRLLAERGLTPDSDIEHLLDPPQNTKQSVLPSIRNRLSSGKDKANDKQDEEPSIVKSNMPAAFVPLGKVPVVKKEMNSDNLPSETLNEQDREIKKIENKIKKRRRSNIQRMFRRFFLFVIFPTLIYMIYLFLIATPLYEAKSLLSVKSNTTTAAGAASLFGQAFDQAPDAMKAQEVITSRPTFERLENDFNFSEIFMDDDIDMFRRLPADANKEERYKNFLKHVKTTYDATQAILILKVLTPDSESAVTAANLIISYTEDAIDKETNRLRTKSVIESQELLDIARAEFEETKLKLLKTRQDSGSLNSTAIAGTLSSSEAELTAQLQQRKAELQALKSANKPNPARVRGTEASIKILENQLAALTGSTTAGDDSISSKELDIRFAELDVEIASAKVKEYESTLSMARASSNAQSKFLTMAQAPFSSFEPVYPKKIISSIVAFFIFFTLYLFASMTFDVIREQVGA